MVRKNRLGNQSLNIERGGHLVTIQATNVAFKTGGNSVRLAQRIEIDSLFRICCRKLKKTAAKNEIYRDIVGKVDSARCLRPDERLQQACLGENEHLRRGRYIQLLQNRRKIAELLVKLKLDLTLIDARL